MLYLKHRLLPDSLGTPSTPTPFKDTLNQPLFVGDIVELFDEDAKSWGLDFVCQDDGEAFVMGIQCSCNAKTGIIEGWTVKKVTHFSDVKVGTEVDGVTLMERNEE